MKTIITIASGLLLASGIAVAGDKPIEKSFKDLDANGDGAISYSEAAASPTLMAHFRDADSDKDERITATEFRTLEQEVEEAE